jgi:glycosidase
MTASLAPREFHVSRRARERYGLSGALFGLRGSLVVADLASIRRLAGQMNAARAAGTAPGAPTVAAGELNALGILHEVFHAVLTRYDDTVSPGILRQALADLEDELGGDGPDRVFDRFAEEFPSGASARLHPGVDRRAPSADWPEARTAARAEALEELLLLSLANANPAAEPLRELFDDSPLTDTDYRLVLARLEKALGAGPPLLGGQPLVTMLRAPGQASPTSLAGQLRYVRDRWASLLGELGLLDRLVASLDILAEEERALELRFGGGVGGFGELHAPSYAGLDDEPERFSSDSEWMPRLVLIAKSTYVWLDQLSRRYNRDIRTLDAIPDEELERLASWGVTGLWLIGLWERSDASERIKRLRGNPDAVASAYSLDDYRIAEDLGGDMAHANLRSRAWARGIRLASDMVPNHMGIDSRWVIEQPDRFISLPDPPYPAYTYNGPDLSSDERVGIFLEDHYYDNSDAAVVFKRLDRWSGESRYIYHGNDGTSFPWNDTAQLDYLKAEVREAVIQTILEVARRFPVIRFDAAMVLAKKHVERLWYPEPGAGGAIPSRAEHAMPKAAFDAAMPVEFWREVVDRVATEVPDTLLLAEAFWLLEGYFVRTLGMHRVYNSAFMHMLRDENNAGYRKLIRDTLEFDPEILKRYVNFMSNPDEKTALEQFGKGDKYFGVATVLATIPGLPMLGHGQVEGFGEKYGMEFRRAFHDEQPDPWLVERHGREIFPLLHARGRYAEVADFRLYDFVRDDGSVDENVLAYSNGRGATRSLVVYHNRYASTAGRIRESAAFADKQPDGSKPFRRSTLVEALGIGIGEIAFVGFRDTRAGLEYLRSVEDFQEDGLWLQLDAYACRVFGEFRELADPAGVWRRLSGHIGGRGVPSLDESLLELELEPVYAALREALGTAGDGRGGSIRRFVQAIRDATGTTGDPAMVAAVATARLAALDGFASEAAGARVHAGDGHVPGQVSGHVSGHGPRDVDPLAPVRPAFADRWHRAVLTGWSLLEPVGKLAAGSMVGPTSRAWFDELRLAPVVAGSLRELDGGLDEGAAWSAADRIRTLLALPRPSNVGGKTQAERARRLVEAWLSHPDVRPFIRVNTWEGVEWFGRSEWRELLDWALLLDAVELEAERARSPEARSAQLHDTVKLALDLAAIGEDAGYRVDRLREAFAPVADESKKVPAKRTGTTPKRRSR